MASGVTRRVSTVLAIEGESEYRQALKNINSEMTTLTSQLKLTESEFANHQNSMEALQAKSEVLAKQQETLAKKVETCKEAYANAQTALSNYQTRTESLKAALTQNQTALDSLSAETKAAGTQWANYQTQLTQAEKELDSLKNSTGDTSEEQAKLEKSISEVKEKMAELESSTNGAAKTAGELVLEQRDLTSELEKSQAGTDAAASACKKWETQQNNAQIQLNKTNAEIELNEKYMDEAANSTDGFATSIDEFGNKVKQADTNTAGMKDTLQNLQSMMLTNVLMNAFKKLASALGSCIDTAAEFESQMSTVEALSGATASEMADLTAVAKEMGATTKFTATEAGEALEYMALAGWSTDEMLEGLAGVMNLAAASGEDLATTSDIVTDALTAFGYSASDSAHFADVLASASANSNTTVSQLGEAFQQVGTTAGTLNYSIDDMAVALGLMANNGLKGSSAGTALATALTRMSGANASATEQLDAWNVSMYNADGTTKDLNTFLKELRTAFQENCDGADEMTTAAYKLAGQKGMKGLLAIVNSTDEDFQSLTASISASTGAAEEMADVRLDNYEGQVTLLKSAFDALKTTIGEQLTPAMGNLATFATNVLNVFNNFISDHPQVTSAITAIAVALGTLAAALTVATVGATAFNAVMTAINANPMILAVSAVVALTAGIVTLVATADDGSASLADFTTAATGMKDAISEADQNIEDVTTSTEAASTVAERYIQKLKDLETQYPETAQEQEEYQAICALLLQIMPELADQISVTTDEYGKSTYALNESTDALLAQVQALKQAAIAQAYQDELNAVYSQYANVLLEAEENSIKLVKANNDLEDLQQQRADTEARMKELYGEASAAAEEYYQNTGELANVSDFLSDEYGELETNLVDLTNQIDATQQEANILTEAIAADEEATNEAKDAIDLAEQAYYTLTGTMAENAEATEGTADSMTLIETYAEDLGAQLIELQQAYDDVYQSAYDSFSGQFDLWEEAAEVSTTSFEDMMSALESQQKYWEEYTDNLDNLMGRQIDGLDDLIDAYGDDAAAVASMAQLNDDELQEMVDQWHTSQEAMSTSAQKYADAVTDYSQLTSDAIQDCVTAITDLDQSEEARQHAYDTLKGYREGLDEESDEVDAELVQVADEILDQFKEELEINSPSKKFEEFGENTLQGFSEGIDNESGDTTSKMEKTAQDFIKAFSGVANSTALTDSGQSTISGYVSGVNNQKTTADKTMQTVAEGALQAFKNKSNTSSLTSSGQDAVTGFVTGVSGKSSTADSKMAATAQSALASFKDNMTSTSLTSAGQNTLQGFINGLNNTASSLYSKMTSIASNALSKFKKTLGIASPSKEMIAAAKFTTAGFVQGIDDTSGDVEDTMEKLAKQAEAAFNPELDYNVSAAQSAFDRSTLAGGEDTETMIQVTVPIYINGQYTRSEIVEIAREGISRKQAGAYAAKGLSV